MNIPANKFTFLMLIVIFSCTVVNAVEADKDQRSEVVEISSYYYLYIDSKKAVEQIETVDVSMEKIFNLYGSASSGYLTDAELLNEIEKITKDNKAQLYNTLNSFYDLRMTIENQKPCFIKEMIIAVKIRDITNNLVKYLDIYEDSTNKVLKNGTHDFVGFRKNREKMSQIAIELTSDFNFIIDHHLKKINAISPKQYNKIVESFVEKMKELSVEINNLDKLDTELTLSENSYFARLKFQGVVKYKILLEKFSRHSTEKDYDYPLLKEQLTNFDSSLKDISVALKKFKINDMKNFNYYLLSSKRACRLALKIAGELKLIDIID